MTIRSTSEHGEFRSCRSIPSFCCSRLSRDRNRSLLACGVHCEGWALDCSGSCLWRSRNTCLCHTDSVRHGVRESSYFRERRGATSAGTGLADGATTAGDADLACWTGDAGAIVVADEAEIYAGFLAGKEADSGAVALAAEETMMWVEGGECEGREEEGWHSEIQGHDDGLLEFDKVLQASIILKK
jgi:hypothetical protein